MKVYKENKYSNKKAKRLKTIKKRIVVLTGLGIIVLCGINIAKTYAEEDNTKIVITTEDKKNSENKAQNTKIAVDTMIDPFKIGSGGVREVNDCLYGPLGRYFYEYAEAYGVDPNLMCAIAMQESSLNHKACIPGGYMYSGYGVGIMQLESPSGEKISAYNYKTGQVDIEYITMEAACDPIKNIKIGCMLFQNSLNYNNGNPLLAIQAHNFGQGMVDLVLSDAYGNFDAIKNDYANFEWVKYMKDAHENPWKYLSGWDESKYGDGEYVNNVLRFFPVDKIKYNYDDKRICLNLKTMKVESQVDLNSKVR